MTVALLRLVVLLTVPSVEVAAAKPACCFAIGASPALAVWPRRRGRAARRFSST